SLARSLPEYSVTSNPGGTRNPSAGGAARVKPRRIIAVIVSTPFEVFDQRPQLVRDRDFFVRGVVERHDQARALRRDTGPLFAVNHVLQREAVGLDFRNSGGDRNG